MGESARRYYREPQRLFQPLLRLDHQFMQPAAPFGDVFMQAKFRAIWFAV